MERELDGLLAGRSELDLGDGTRLRLLSALEILEVGREAAALARGEREKALCSNACLLARALTRDGAPVYAGGQEVLEGLRVEEIARLSRQWAQFNRRENPSPEDGEERTQTLKKAWSTRPTSALNGACSRALARFRRPRRPGP